MTRSGSGPASRIDAYDGLRAVAVAAILCYHARFTWASGAFVSLTVFFTLSGFLITTLLVRAWERHAGIAFRQFLVRRARRLLPAAWTTLGLIVAMGVVGIWDDAQRRDIVTEVPASIAQVVNWLFVFQGRTYGAEFASPSPVQHFWSLAVEEQLYLFIPLVLLVLLRLGTRTRTVEGGGGKRYLDHRVPTIGFAVLVVAGAAASWCWARVDINGAYFSTVSRSGEVLVGSLLACVLLQRTGSAQRRDSLLDVHRRVRPAQIGGWAGVAVIVAVASVARPTDIWMYPWGFLAVAAATGAIIVASGRPGLMAAALSWRPMVWFGRRSYTVYLVHWPVFLWLTPARVGLGPWPLFALRLVVTVAASEVLHRLVELPGQRIGLGSAVPRHRPALLSVGVLVVAAGLISASWMMGSNAREASSLERFSAGEVAAPTVAPPPIRVLVVGDELAASAGGWTTIAGSPDVIVNVFSTPSCGLAVGGWVRLGDGTVERDRNRCGDVAAQRSRAVADSGADVVLIWGGLRDATDRKLSDSGEWLRPGTPGGDEFLRTEMGALVDAAGAGGARVGVLTVPHVRAVPTSLPPVDRHLPEAEDERAAVILQDQAVAMGAPVGGPAENDDARIDRINELIGEVAASRQVPVVDIASQMRVRPGGEHDPAFRADGVGLSAAGAAEMAPWLGEEVRALRRSTAAPVAPPTGGVLGDLSIPPAPNRPARVPPRDRRVRAMVIGDSVAYNQLVALTEQRDGPALDMSGRTKLGCPLARGGDRRFLQDVAPFNPDCDWGPPAAGLLDSHRPDVVLLSGGVWEVVDRRFPGDERWRHVGQPEVDDFVRREIVAAIDTYGATGAVVAVATTGHFEAGRAEGFSGLPESDPARVDRLNQLIGEAVAQRPGAAVVIDVAGWLATRPGGGLDPSIRSDGIHFDDAFLPTLGSWLSTELDRIARTP